MCAVLTCVDMFLVYKFNRIQFAFEPLEEGTDRVHHCGRAQILPSPPTARLYISSLLHFGFMAIISARVFYLLPISSFFSLSLTPSTFYFCHQYFRILPRYPIPIQLQQQQNHHHNQPTTDQLHNNINTAPTSSSFSLYNKSEPYVPFSALKTEYQRQYGGGVSPTPQRATLRRRSTSLKLPARQRLSATDADGGIGDADLLDLTMGESEQHAEYHPYTEDEQSQYVYIAFVWNGQFIIESPPTRCRRTLAHRPDHQFVDAAQPNLHFDGHLSIQPTTAATVDIDPKNVAAAGSVTPNEPHGIASKHRTLLGGGQHAAERCHLHLSGELSYAPEYRSQFVGFPAPIEKSHSIPQLSNIRFQGKFGGVAEYRDSFREYDRYARCAPIRNPGHLRTAGAVATTATTASEAKSAGEYAEKFQAPLAPERVVRAHRQEDQFSLTPVAGDVGGGTAATRSTERTAPVDMAKPVRGRPKCDFLALKGSMEYNPEYR